MVGRVKRIRSRARSQQPAVTRKKVLEAQIRGEVSLGCCDGAVIFGTVAGKHQRLRLIYPFEGLGVKAPEIPFCRGDIGAVGVKMLNGKRRDFRRAIAQILQVPLGKRKFRGIDGLHDEFLERGLRSGKRRSRQKSSELGNQSGFGELARPHAQISSVSHSWSRSLIIRMCEPRGEFERRPVILQLLVARTISVQSKTSSLGQSAGLFLCEYHCGLSRLVVKSNA